MSSDRSPTQSPMVALLPTRSTSLFRPCLVMDFQDRLFNLNVLIEVIRPVVVREQGAKDPR